jgi:carboxyl-terminal processing protease
MSNWQKWFVSALLLVVIASTAFVAGFGIGHYVVPGSGLTAAVVQEEQEEQFRVFWEAWSLIEERFYTEEPLDEQAMTYGAIRGMVASLGDRHTVFLTPDQASLFREDLEGEFGGIGVTVGMTDEGQLRVVRPIPGSPGEQVGLKPGDIILEVDGESITGMDLVQAIHLIRGPQGTEVRLLVQDTDGNAWEAVITRALIEIPTTESRVLEDGIAYLAVYDCNARAPREAREALKQLLGEDPGGLILDLRGNPGGYLHVAKEIASEFIADGLLLIERDSEGRETLHNARRGGTATEIPLVVLVDRGSASAAEIIAGAIQDNDRGILVGERSFGKGSVQITERLSDGSGLQITTRRWYTPADRRIEGQGLTPDIDVDMTDEDLLAQRDPQLERAIAYLLSRLSV